jgi:sigma-B regulation protein RsbU (phosphoserine phosphatase)
MSKIKLAFLLVCLAALLLISVTMLFSLVTIRTMTLMSNNHIGTIAADNSKESLWDQAILNTTELVVVKSTIIDQELRKAANMVELLKGYIEQIYRSKEDFRLIKIPNMREVPPEEVSLHWNIETGKIPDMKYNERDLVRAGLLEETYLLGNLEKINQLIVKNIPDISTVYVSTESGQNIQYDGDAAIKMPYATSAVLRNRPWYTSARELGDLYISDTYRDMAGRGLSISITSPFYDRTGQFMGVAGIDIRIEDLDESIRKIVVGKNGYAFLIDNRSGEDKSQSKIISAPGLNENNENDLAAFMGSNAAKVIADMKVWPSGYAASIIEIEGKETKVDILWAPVKLTGWQLAYVVPEDDILAPALALYDEIIGITEVTVERVDGLIFKIFGVSAGLLLLIIFLTTWAARLVAGRIAMPITIFTEHVKKISNGNLDYHSEIRTGDEIEELSLTFERMTVELKNYIKDLNRVTAEKERIGAELNVATKIQASMLPNIFPPFPSRKEFDIYASMLPAKEVGGDFYDFFLIDENTLAVLIADVSGKGVPAALFMVIAKTLIKNNAQNGSSPKEVFEKVNNLLCINNEESMFVTVFMGYLDIPTGKFTCVNAGHNPPLIKRGDEFNWLKIKRGLVLGGMENISYIEEEMTLKPGDMVYFYTDGVTEAINSEEEFFSDDRLFEAVVACKDQGVREFAVSIKQEVDAFVQDAEQADDITMLVMRYMGDIKWKELKIGANIENLTTVQDFVHAELEKVDCPPKIEAQIDIAVEETFVNIASYAYTPDQGTVIIRAAVSGNEIWLEFEDTGKAYNPLEKSDPDITAGIDERPIGGLGIFMIKRMMDTVEYRCDDNRNLFTLKKKFD